MKLKTPATLYLNKIILPALLAAAVLLTACGGGSGSSNNNNPDEGIKAVPVFGQQGSNACFYSQTNEADLACYLVPGGEGETPTDYYAGYQRTSDKFGATGIETYSWSGITQNTAQYEVDGETFHFEWDDTVDEIIQIDRKGKTDESKLTRPLTPVIDANETVTNVEPGDTQTGALVVFEPKTRTVKVPGTTRTIKAYNAIMAVQTFEYGNGSGLVSVEHYAPKEGVVATVKYLNCPDVANLNFIDDANYYESQCAGSNDRAFIKQKEGPSSPGGSSNTGGSGNTNTGIAANFANLLGVGGYGLNIGISRAGGLPPINEIASNVALPSSEQDMCNKLKAESIAIITDGNNYSGGTVTCAWASSAMYPFEKQAIINFAPHGQAVFGWVNN